MEDDQHEDEKITSQNDWGPVHRNIDEDREFKRDDFFQSWSYKLLRFPLCGLILLWCTFLVIIYFFVRVYIALYESFFTWRGERRKLRINLRKSLNYKEWVENAEKLDVFLNLNKWKDRANFYYYDFKTLKLTNNKLRKLTNNESVEELINLLPNVIKPNFAGTENPILYSQTYYGTKRIVQEYNDNIVKALDFIIDDDKISPVVKLQLFKSLNKNFGKTALCLSGGACFAYNHFGVIKALVDNDLLPNIISGCSGGGLIAALATTRTNEELKELIKPELSKKITACSDPFSVWFKRFLKTGARFDSVDWARKSMWFTMGSLTFKEVYERTGKILNISTVPSDIHSPVILCNHITSPNVVVWSTLLASSAIPGILNPVVLMIKDPKTGKIEPSFNLGVKYKDGSLRTDIPIESLNTYYNVKFSIVSQVNPHISLFFFAPKGSVGRPVSRKKVGLRGGFIGAGLENYIKLENRKWLKLIRSLDLLPHLMDQDWSNLWLQKFSGTITMWPKIHLSDFWYILSDPTAERLADMIKAGQLSAFPKLLFIKNRLNIERRIETGLRKYKKVVRELRRNNSNNNRTDNLQTKIRESLISSDSDDDNGHRKEFSNLDTAIEGLNYQVRFDSPDNDESDDIDDEDKGPKEAYDEYDDDSDSEDNSSKLRRRSTSWWST